MYAERGNTQPFRDLYNSLVLEQRVKASLTGKTLSIPLWSSKEIPTPSSASVQTAAPNLPQPVTPSLLSPAGNPFESS